MFEFDPTAIEAVWLNVQGTPTAVVHMLCDENGTGDQMVFIVCEVPQWGATQISCQAYARLVAFINGAVAAKLLVYAGTIDGRHLFLSTTV